MPLAGYAWSSLITADTSSLAATETNIPLPHFLPDMTGKRLQASWYDVVPCLMDGVTVPDFYLEVKSDTVGVMHVEWPTLTAGNPALQLGHLNVGKADAVDLSNEAGTFGNNFAGRWGMSDAGPTTVADSLGVNNGTQSGGVTFGATGQMGKCCSFDGIDNTINLGTGIQVQTAVAFSAWINPSGSGERPIGGSWLGGVPRWNLDLYQNRLLLQVGLAGSPYVQGDTVLTNGIWHHAAGVWNGTDLRVYANGVLDCTPLAAVGTMAVGTQPTYLATYNGVAPWFNGSIDDARLSLVDVAVSWFLAEYIAGADTLFSYGAWVAAAAGRALFLGPNLWTGGKAMFREANL